MKLDLVNAPNQEVPFYADNHFVILKLRLFRGVLFATVVIDGDTVVASRRVVAGENIFRYGYLSKKYGELKMMSKYNTPVTDYSEYNSSVYLQYDLPKSED